MPVWIGEECNFFHGVHLQNRQVWSKGFSMTEPSLSFPSILTRKNWLFLGIFFLSVSISVSSLQSTQARIYRKQGKPQRIHCFVFPQIPRSPVSLPSFLHLQESSGRLLQYFYPGIFPVISGRSKMELCLTASYS